MLLAFEYSIWLTDALPEMFPTCNPQAYSLCNQGLLIHLLNATLFPANPSESASARKLSQFPTGVASVKQR